MKRTILTLSLALAAVFLVNCHDDEDLPITKRLDFDVLSTVFAPFDKEDELLPATKERTMIINSVEDIRQTQTERFIEENPNWQKVDFEKKTIIAFRSVTAYGDRWIASRVTSFDLCLRDNVPSQKGDYVLNIRNRFTKTLFTEEPAKENYKTFQIAIVCDKIPSTATVRAFYSESYE